MHRKKKSQIFLLLTLLMLTFFISITDLLLDIDKAQYTDPAAGTQIFIQTWDNTYQAVVDLTQTALARFTQSTNTSNLDVEISNELDIYEDYLLQRGFTLTMLLNQLILDTSLSPASYEITAIYSIALRDGKNELTQILTINSLFSATFVGDIITVLKTINGESAPISDAQVTVIAPGTSTVTNLKDGRYRVSVITDSFEIITPEGVLLQV